MSTMDFSTAWINGRSLAKVLREYKPAHRFGAFGPTDRVRVSIPDDLYILGLDRTLASPFVIEGNLLVTAHDVDQRCDVIELPNMRFTANALRSAADEIVSDPKTRQVSSLGSSVVGAGPDKALQFSKQVCEWGGGHRVWGKLIKRHGREILGAELVRWFELAAQARTPAQAIVPGASMKGLGVSYASKHLRHLDPTRFAVLDDVIGQGLGYALNPAGYNLFVADLKRLQRDHFNDLPIASIEAGLYNLVRQIVRGRED
jgi:hypothetical protein